MKIYIFGLGERKKYLDRCLIENVSICGYIDNYKADKINTFAGKPVVKQDNLCKDYDIAGI